MTERFVRSISHFAALVVLLIGAVGPLAAQEARTGRVVGRIIDAQTGAGLADVGVQIVGTTLGATSGVDGRFAVPGVPAGTVTIQVRRLGYAPKTVTGLVLDPGQSLEQNVAMQPATVQLQAQVVTASAERGTVSEALDAQRTATGIVNAVTAEQISRSPDGDAAQAVQRVSGVTVQDDKFVFVRGLGERYTTTSLNGTRLPSPEPERRVVPLDLFPSGLLQTITTSKTFTPDLQGDFSGAHVDIRTREFPARRQLTWSLTMGYKGGATGSDVLGARGVGGEWLADAGGERGLPFILRSVGNLQGIDLNQGDKHLLVGSFRNAWTPESRTGTPNTSMGFSLGGNDPVLFGRRLGYLVSGTYSYSQEARTGQVRALANRGTTAGETFETDRFEGESGNVGVLWGGIANFSTLLGSHTRLSFSNTYNRTADHQARTERGALENEGIEARIDRMQYVERSVRSNQLAGEHQLGARHRFDWAATSSAVGRDEPDRSEFVYVIERDQPDGPEVLRWLNTGNAGAVRTFARLDETTVEGRANYQLTFPTLGQEHSIKVGVLHRATDRDADNRAYSISAPGLPNAVRELRPELLFDGRYAQPSEEVRFEIAPLSQGGSYDAEDRLTAGFAMAELGLGARLRLIGGARVEHDELTVRGISTLGSPALAEKDWTDVLPSAALTFRVTESQNLRLALSRTLARPEYRELSPVKSRDVINGDDLEGNPALERTRIGNADIRWEWYPSSGEVVSLGLFAKSFDRPIERVYRAAGASSRFIGYVNAESATNYGVELELRKDLGFLHDRLAPFSLFSNLTVMESEIELGEAQSAATNTARRMVGQAPYVVNAGVTYASAGDGTSATLLYHRVGERIDAAGDQPLPDVIEEPRDVLDLSLRLPLLESLAVRLDARNLLDAPHELTQGSVTRESYRVGRSFQAGLTWRP